MANDVQTITVGVEAGTDANQLLLQTPPLTPLVGNNSQPISLMTFRGKFALDGSGVGDTAETRIFMVLPIDTMWQMLTCFVGVEDTVAFDICTLELPVRESSVAFPNATVLSYPFIGSDLPTHPGSTNMVTFNLAGGNNLLGGTSMTPLPTQSPFAFLSYAIAGAVPPKIILSGGTSTNITGEDCSFCVQFLGYTLEQGLLSELYANPALRG